jgi:TonB family protein
MKKNSIFLSMIGLSAAFHGLVLVGVPGDGFRTPPPAQEDKIVSTIRMIKLGTPPPVNTPDKPQEKRLVEKTVEPLPEISPVQEAVLSEEMREDDETQERDTGNNEEAPEGSETQGQEKNNDNRNNEVLQDGRAEENGAAANREYEALLAYIKDFISNNLVYPLIARRRNIQGTVGISFEIETNGELVSVSVNGSSGSSVLDNAALSLVKKIRPFENVTIKRKLTLRVNIEYKLTE